jgi:hypothetical protein
MSGLARTDPRGRLPVLVCRLENPTRLKRLVIHARDALVIVPVGAAAHGSPQVPA